MEHQQRIDSLKKLGIVYFVPNQQLPAAAPSAPEIFLPLEAKVEDNKTLVSTSSNTAEQPKQKMDLSALTQELSKVPVEPKIEVEAEAEAKIETKVEPKVTPKTEPEVESKAEPTVEPKQALNSAPEPQPEPIKSNPTQAQPKFKLAFVRYADYLLIDSLPPQSMQNFSQTHNALAAAILQVISGKSMQAQGAPSLLSWPAFASPTLAQGYDDALQAVQRKLNLLLDNSEITKVLIMGQSAAQMVFNTQQELTDLNGKIMPVREGVQALATYSLTEAMQLPDIKQQIWLDVQPLLQP